MNHPDISNFTRTCDHLICIDSDGTAIDAMNVKHNRCHGPALIEEWGLQSRAAEVQTLWNEINLFSGMRGVNRFIALAEALGRMDGEFLQVDGLEVLKAWVSKSQDLSNKGLEEEIRLRPHGILAKALSWSRNLNKKIAGLTAAEKVRFPGVKECLEAAQGRVDIAVISSSNMDAIYEEWGHADLLKYISVMTSQEIGTKGECLARMLEKGYAPANVLMVGDAFPDIDAAQETGVMFYPILTGHEERSWTDLRKVYLGELVSGHYKDYQELLIKKFHHNFTAE